MAKQRVNASCQSSWLLTADSSSSSILPGKVVLILDSSLCKNDGTERGIFGRYLNKWSTWHNGVWQLWIGHFIFPFFPSYLSFICFPSPSVYFSSAWHKDGVLTGLNIEQFLLVVSYTSFRAVIINCSITRFSQNQLSLLMSFPKGVENLIVQSANMV